MSPWQGFSNSIKSEFPPDCCHRACCSSAQCSHPGSSHGGGCYKENCPSGRGAAPALLSCVLATSCARRLEVRKHWCALTKNGREWNQMVWNEQLPPKMADCWFCGYTACVWSTRAQVWVSAELMFSGCATLLHMSVQWQPGCGWETQQVHTSPCFLVLGSEAVTH